MDPVHMDEPKEAKAEPEPALEWTLNLPPAAYVKQTVLELPAPATPPILDEAEETTDAEIAALLADLPI